MPDAQRASTTTPALINRGKPKGDSRSSTPRIWTLQYGPCWCRSDANDSVSFDYLRFRRTVADLGIMKENLLIVSARVIDGTSHVYREVFADVPDPKLIVAAAACPASQRFWEELPNGWGAVEEVIPVDIHVEECVTGYPEALLAAVLGHVAASTNEQRSASAGG